MAIMILSPRVCQNQKESACVSHSPPESARVSKSQPYQPPSIRVIQIHPDSARDSQGHQMSCRVGQSQSELARICQSKPEFQVVFLYLSAFFGLIGAPGGPLKHFQGKTGAKLQLWPQNHHMKSISVFRVTIQKRSQK